MDSKCVSFLGEPKIRGSKDDTFSNTYRLFEEQHDATESSLRRLYEDGSFGLRQGLKQQSC